MRPFTASVMALTGIVVAVAIYVTVGPDCVSGIGKCEDKKNDDTGLTATPSSEIVISIASSITKTEWLEKAVREFNEQSEQNPQLQSNGKPIQVEILKETDDITGNARHWNSASITNETLSRTIEPTVISPATQTWVLKLNKEWTIANGEEIATGSYRSLLSTPVAIAMWRSRAEALGCWPVSGPGCTWSDIRNLAVDPEGWGSLGHPEWGKFHLGYARVGASDVATQTVALICMAGLGKTADLTVEDVTVSNGCGQAMADVEKSISHRGTSSPLLIKAMLDGGPSFLDAITTYEKNVLQSIQSEVRADPLVSVTPSDGVVIADHVFAVLDKAPWVSDEQVEAARVFEEFLHSEPMQQNLSTDHNLRRATDGQQSDIRVLEVPSVEVLDQVIEIWSKVKKKANIVLVFDKSGSMNETASADSSDSKLEQAISGATKFVDSMDNTDRLTWLPFNDQIFTGVSGEKGAIGEDLVAEINATNAAGGTALYDAIDEARNILLERRKEKGDEERYGIVVLSDGEDTASKWNTITNLELKLIPNPEFDPIGIEVHTIGIGTSADDGILDRIAEFTIGGQYWDVEDGSAIEAVYERISRYF